MPLSVVVHGVLERDAAFAPGIGRALYAWVLDRIRQVDAGAAQSLQDGEGRKPLTVSTLQGQVHSAAPGLVRAAAGTAFWVRCTALEAGTEQVVLRALEGARGGVLEAGGIRLGGLALHTSAAGHPWAAAASYQELFDGSLADPPPETLSLRFCSPTTFRTREGNLPFPLPALVFRTLVQKWNLFAPIDLGGFLAALETAVRVQAYHCQTHRLHLGRHGEVGFTGTACFDLRGLGDPLLAKVAGCLGAYAFYGGIGAKTTMGFGQARVTQDPLPARVPV